jgi:hypothetical protein
MFTLEPITESTELSPLEQVNVRLLLVHLKNVIEQHLQPINVDGTLVLTDFVGYLDLLQEQQVIRSFTTKQGDGCIDVYVTPVQAASYITFNVIT